MTDSSKTRLAYVEESTYGTTPATPTMLEARMTGESLNANIENVRSNEIRADRNVSDLVQVGQNAGGGVDIELSYGSFDDWLESLMFNTWATNVLKNGNVQKSFTLEKTFETGATDQYHRFTGAIANSLSLSMQSNNIVTGSFDFVAQGASTAQAAISGSSYTGANANPVINAAVNFASLTINGVTGPELTQLNLNITNNLRPQPKLGSLDSKGVGTGTFEVTGDMVMYFENAEAYDLFLAGTASDLSFELGGASSKKYQFDIGNLKFDTADIPTPGNNQDIFLNISFVGLYDGTDNTLQITRTP